MTAPQLPLYSDSVHPADPVNPVTHHLPAAPGTILGTLNRGHNGGTLGILGNIVTATSCTIVAPPSRALLLTILACTLSCQLSAISYQAQIQNVAETRSLLPQR